MANAHVGRRQAIGLGKESTSGTAVAVTTWIPKASGSFSPKFGTVVDDAAYGVIDSIRETQTVKQTTEVNLSAAIRDKYIGDILLLAFGLSYPCVKFPIPGSITGTFVEGETVTESTSTATGVLRRLDAQ